MPPFGLWGFAIMSASTCACLPGGTFFVMEANVTPSMEPLEPLSLSARWAGMDFPVLLERILASAAKRRPPVPAGGVQDASIALPTGAVGLRIPPGVHVPPPSTIEMARLLDVRPGERVLELGCGTGLLAIAAAKQGAGHVVAVDLDGQALDAAVKNAQLNGLSDRIEVRAGSWYEAVKAGEIFDVIIATPPQTPGPRPFGPRYGGADGAKHLLAVVGGGPGPPRPGDGAGSGSWPSSIANVPELMRKLRGRFNRGRCHG